MLGRVPPLGIAVLGPLAVIALTLLSPCASRAQSSQAARDARRMDMEMRQRALRAAEKLNDEQRKKPADNRPLYREVAENFEQLQVRNHSLAEAARRADPVDYALIKREAAEVRKRAARLKEYLLLPKPDEGRPPSARAEAVSAGGLREAVATLDALVNGFVRNPIFQRPDVVDLEQSSKAGRDLAGIIRLSEQIRRCAEESGGSKGNKKAAAVAHGLPTQ